MLLEHLCEGAGRCRIHAPPWKRCRGRVRSAPTLSWGGRANELAGGTGPRMRDLKCASESVADCKVRRLVCEALTRPQYGHRLLVRTPCPDKHDGARCAPGAVAFMTAKSCGQRS